MRRQATILVTLCLLTLLPSKVKAQGIPLLHNFTSSEYKAHNQNFDIITGEDGTVYVANFEGLLYYDNATWRIIHNPGVTRITSLFRDSKGVIWTGGYNYIGCLRCDNQGRLYLHSIDSQKVFQGEVEWIWETDGQIYFLVSGEKIYHVVNDNVQWAAGAKLPTKGFATLSDQNHVNQVQELEDGLKVLATNGSGLVFQDRDGRKLFSITTENGLCSNNISHITYNRHGLIWGATDNGIFVVGFPSIYTHYTEYEGLKGEVLSMAMLQQQFYAGTISGLYIRQGQKFSPVKGIDYACWQLANQDNSLLAATSNGVYRISPGGNVQQLTTANTLSLLVDEHGFYSGEMDGVFYNTPSGRKKVSDIEKVVKIMADNVGTIWIKNLYGKLWKGFEPYSEDGDEEAMGTLVMMNDVVVPITTNTTVPFTYPMFSYQDPQGVLWLTDSKGRHIRAYENQKMSDIVYPLMDYSVQTMLREGNMLWLGSDKGINAVYYTRTDPAKAISKPRLLLRSVLLHGDSVLWGGYGRQIEELGTLPSDDHHVTFHFSIDYPSMLLLTQYRTRINGGKWSAWDNDTQEEYANLPTGDHTFEVQARDAFGKLSNIITVTFSIAPPFYLRWYMILLYFLLFIGAVYVFMTWRTNRLEHEKLRLERLVKERTAEVVKLEKVATVGKLTQGLIDRILNPLNYINNFTKLSEGLVGDIRANIEDEKEHMDADNYDDTMDVLDMLKGNLQKVGEHGANTTRTLKAMEEMMKDRSGGISRTNITPLLHQNEEMVHKYFEKEIAEQHIRCIFVLPKGDVYVNGNAEQLSKTFMSMLANAVYAVVKQAQRHPGEDYRPEVAMHATINPADSLLVLRIRDNGIGIEHTIINKIFDPFFTTKTTAEATGVGLYLCHEIVQNYGGEITVESEKNQFTEFTITLPTTA